MALILFLIQVVSISLSGVLAPGPITAVTVAAGARNRWAGPLMALGHGIVEFPLMGVIVMGAGRFLETATARFWIGAIGGLFLLFMGGQMLWSLRSQATSDPVQLRRGPLVAGIVLTGGNPYFLVWWATVGLALATRARDLGIWAFVLFALCHWLCDLVWLTILSFASFQGTRWFGPRVQRVIVSICGAALLLFGLWFLIDAAQR